MLPVAETSAQIKLVKLILSTCNMSVSRCYMLHVMLAGTLSSCNKCGWSICYNLTSGSTGKSINVLTTTSVRMMVIKAFRSLNLRTFLVDPEDFLYNIHDLTQGCPFAKGRLRGWKPTRSLRTASSSRWFLRGRSLCVEAKYKINIKPSQKLGFISIFFMKYLATSVYRPLTAVAIARITNPIISNTAALAIPRDRIPKYSRMPNPPAITAIIQVVSLGAERVRIPEFLRLDLRLAMFLLFYETLAKCCLTLLILVGIDYFARVPKDLNLRAFLVNAKDRFHHGHYLAKGCIGAHRVQQERHGVFGAGAGEAQLVERLAHGGVVALFAQLLEAGDLAPLAFGVHFEDWHVVAGLVGEGVDAHDQALVGVHFALVAIGGFGDLALEEAALDGRQHAAHLVDLAEVGQRLLLHAIGLRLDEEGAAQRVDCVGHAGLFGNDLLRAQGDSDGVL